MTGGGNIFADGKAYEVFMGRWNQTPKAGPPPASQTLSTTGGTMRHNVQSHRPAAFFEKYARHSGDHKFMNLALSAGDKDNERTICARRTAPQRTIEGANEANFISIDRLNCSSSSVCRFGSRSGKVGARHR